MYLINLQCPFILKEARLTYKSHRQINHMLPLISCMIYIPWQTSKCGEMQLKFLSVATTSNLFYCKLKNRTKL